MDLCQPHFLRSLFSAAVKIDIGFSKLIPKRAPAQKDTKPAIKAADLQKRLSLLSH